MLPFVLLTLLAILPGSPLLVLSVLAVLLLIRERRWQWLWRLVRHVRSFRTMRGGQIVLHYAPELSTLLNLPGLLQRCQVELDRMTDIFGSPLRGKATVYLFANHRDIATIFGAHFGGAALIFANSIAIADSRDILESIRHEFAHLFSARWNRSAPPLLEEGLSIWLQETTWGQPIDRAVLPMLGNRSLKLPLLLKSKFFFAELHLHSCYVLAGSFTGFIIRRHGWDLYRKFFRICDGRRSRAKFKKCFGVTLEKAEWQWRNEITVTEVLNRRLKSRVQ